MKNLITYLALLICISVNAQRAEDIHAKTEELNKYKTEWSVNVEHQIYELIKGQKALEKDLSNALKKIENQSEHITQLKINALKDSLKIEKLTSKIKYTQSFIKDSVVFVLDAAPELETNLIKGVESYNDGWWDNEDGSYYYNSNVKNYSYIYFSLKENLKPQATYIISFTIQLQDPNREALINLWFYDNSGNTRLSDTYYGEGKHTIEVEFDVEKIKMAARARNNNGGSFKFINPKIEEKQ